MTEYIGQHIFCECGKEMACLGLDPDNGWGFMCSCGRTIYLPNEG